MFDTVSILVEIAFVVSFAGFFLLLVLIPSKKAIASGNARGKMGSPIVPILILLSIVLALAMIPLAFFADTVGSLVGFVTAPLLLIAHFGIAREYAGARRSMSPPHLEVEEVHAVHATQASHPQMMTVECPGCQGHLSIPNGSHQIVCPHCGLTGSL